MRLSCNQKDLANALSITNKAVNQNNTLPVLNNVFLRAEGKKLHFTTTNLEIAISYWMEADVKNEGSITIPSRLFTNYVSYLKDDKLDLSVEEGDAVVIKSSDSVTKLKGIPASEFPPIPNVDKEGEVILIASDLKKAIDQVVFAASLTTTRPVLSGVYMLAEKSELLMVATDSYRLAEKKLKAEKASGRLNCIVPARTLVELSGILDALGKVDTVEVIISKNQILFTVGEVRVTSRLIEGQFPNYQQIVPKNIKTTIHFDVKELSLALKRINIFAKENNNKVIFKITRGGVVVTTDSTQYGEGEVQLNVAVDGADNEVALNSQYVLDVLNNIDGGSANFELGEKTSPVIVRPTKATDYIHIIMPLKI